MTTCRALAIVMLALVGCGGSASFHAAWPDVQLELRDAADRLQAIDELWVTPAGPARDRLRASIADALVARISDAIDEDQPFVAASLLDQLCGLWQTDPAAIGAGLSRYAALVRELRGVFAKSGALEPAIQALVLLIEIEPAARAEHLAELDEVLAFADELAVADNGPNATRAQPIALLEPTALGLPLPWLVERYVTLQVDRQRAVVALLDKQGASMPLVRAHHDLLSTARRIAAVLARAGRASDIHKQLARLVTGYGSDRELVIRAEVVADQPTPGAYAALAGSLRIDERAPDPLAALAICLAGLAKFPGDAMLLAGAGGDARELGRIDQAIALYEQALRASELDTAIALRLGKLYADRIQRLASGGRPSAANDAWRAALRFNRAAAKTHPHSVWNQATAVAESALGRGFASQGLLGDARRALAASLERAPSVEAYETLVTINTQTDRYTAAQQGARSALALLGNHAGDRYRRAKLERLAGETLRRAHQPRLAAVQYLDSLRTWASMGETKDLPRLIAAERELDMGRTMWALGDPGKAVELTLQAIDRAPESEELATNAVAFLIQAGRYRDALDAFHACLAAPAISEYHKVYMSLWIVAEATRLGEPRDPLASDFLASRHGELWYENLAQLASGTIAFADVAARATTGPRRAELAFYGAVLGLDPAAATPAGRAKALRDVIAARLVLDAEYDLARMYLQEP